MKDEDRQTEEYDEIITDQRRTGCNNWHSRTRAGRRLLLGEIVGRSIGRTGFERRREKVAEAGYVLVEAGRRVLGQVEVGAEERVACVIDEAVGARAVGVVGSVVQAVRRRGVSGTRAGHAVGESVAVVVSGGGVGPFLTGGGIVRKGRERWQQRREIGRGRRAAAATTADAAAVLVHRRGAAARRRRAAGVRELARRLALPPLGAAVLEPHLDARLAQLQPQRQLFAREHVRVGRALERSFQLFQLIRSECRPAIFGQSQSNYTCVVIKLELYQLCQWY